ncbi:MAG: hypothetical protein V3V08_18560, partial [Nannocystaceae bacterium]
MSCSCDVRCHEQWDDCLIVVHNGSVSTVDPVLQNFTLECSIIDGDSDIAAVMRCSGVDHKCDSDDDGAPGVDPDAPPENACSVPVPAANILAGPIWGEYDIQFYIPHPSWAFSTAHAWKWLRSLDGVGLSLRLTPSFFFATALKESYMGCSDLLPEPDPFLPGRLERRAAAYADGCFQIESTTAWIELCRMFEPELDCDFVGHGDVVSSSAQAQTGRDNFATSALVKAYYDTFAYSMIPHLHKVADPNAWFADAIDPLAMEKVIAVLYNRGVWSGDATAIQGGSGPELGQAPESHNEQAALFAPLWFSPKTINLASMSATPN